MDKLFQNGAFIPCSHKPTWLHQRSHLMSKHFVKSATAKMFENKKKNKDLRKSLHKLNDPSYKC